MKKRFFRIIGIILAVFLIVAAVIAVPVIKEYFSGSVYDGHSRIFYVEPNSTYKDIAQKLEKEGIINNKYSFMIKYKLTSSEYDGFKHGEHIIKGGMSLEDIIETLTLNTKTVETVKVTIPEGFSVDLIAQRMENSGLCTYAEFMEAVKKDVYDYQFLKYIPESEYAYRLEGYLFPDTYEFPKDVTAKKIVNTMLLRFENVYLTEVGTYDDFHKIMTIASLVEREASLASERDVISGVIYNRLKIDMLLQIDASVIYAKTLGKYDMETVLNADLQVDSPYNIYRNKGLPPGPICCPGRDSIIAGAKPASHDYLYYHTDETKKDGSHIFTKTHDEHLQTMN